MSLNIYTFESVILYKSERYLVPIIYLLVCQEWKRNTSRNQSSVHIWVVCKRKSKLETKIQQNRSRVCFFFFVFDWITLITRAEWSELTPMWEFLPWRFVCFFYWFKCLFSCLPAPPIPRSLSLLLFLMLQILYRSSLTVSKLDKFKLIYSFHFVHLEINLLQTFWECSQFSRISPHNTNARMLKCWDPFDLRQHRLHA